MSATLKEFFFPYCLRTLQSVPIPGASLLVSFLRLGCLFLGGHQAAYKRLQFLERREMADGVGYQMFHATSEVALRRLGVRMQLDHKGPIRGQRRVRVLHRGFFILRLTTGRAYASLERS